MVIPQWQPQPQPPPMGPRLAEYDIVLRWRAGTENLMPGALSRLPLHTGTELTDIDDSFPDDPSSSAPNHYVGPRGPTLYNIALAHTPPDERRHNDTPLAALFSHPRQTPLVKIPARDHKQHSINPNMFPFAACAVLDPGDPTTLWKPKFDSRIGHHVNNGV